MLGIRGGGADQGKIFYLKACGRTFLPLNQVKYINTQSKIFIFKIRLL